METHERSNAERAAVPPAATEPSGAFHPRRGEETRVSSDPMVLFPSGERVPLSSVLNDRATRAHHLRDHHRSAGGVLCLCRADGIPMGVARRQAPEETFYLYPLHRGDRLRHAPGCPHFLGGNGEVSSEEGKGVVERIGGRIRVNLSSAAFTMPAGPRNPDAEAVAGEDVEETRAGAAGGLLTLLQVLWAEAELNLWRPGFAGRRGYGVVYYRLQEAARRIDVKTAELDPRLYLPPRFRERGREWSIRALHRFLEALKPDKKGKRWFGFVAGLLRTAARQSNGTIAVHLANGSRPVWTTSLAWARIVRTRREAEIDDLGEGPAGTPKIVLMKVSREESRTGAKLQLEEFAALALADTRCWIPVGSAYERELALALASAGRRFRKPLAPEVDGGALLPSFVLEDRRDRMHIEILTRMEEEECRIRAGEKQRRYEELQQSVFWWDVRESEAVPVLPARAP